MADELTFTQLLDMLPQGNFHGVSEPAFQIASPPDLFVEPTLRSVDRTGAAGATLISARGATGKSTLARILSAKKQVPLWLLNEDYGVSAHILETRLNNYINSRNGLQQFVERPGVFILVDALDEARMRVSGGSWKEFVDSISTVASHGHHFVFFGRERILEDLWADLIDRDVAIDWLEISHFNLEQRIRYVDSRIAGHRSVQDEMYRSTRDAILEVLSSSVDEGYSDSFVGYAPVLDAAVALLNSRVAGGSFTLRLPQIRT